MMTQTLNTLLLVGVFATASIGGLIIAPTNGSTVVMSGSTVSFDLIVKNETPPGIVGESSPGAGDGTDVEWTFSSVGSSNADGFRFCTESDSLGGGSNVELLSSSGVTYNPTLVGSVTGANGFTPFGFPFPGGTVEVALTGPSTTLGPGDSIKFGTLEVDIPAGYTGNFSFILANDLALANASGQNATALPPAVDPVPDWIHDPNEPMGDCTATPPPPGGGVGGSGASAFTFTAVPEPSGFLFMSCVGLLVGGLRFYRRKLGE